MGSHTARQSPPGSPDPARMLPLAGGKEHQQQIRYDDLFSNLPDVVLYESGGGRQHFTANLPRIFGLSYEQYLPYIGHFDVLVHPEDLPGCEKLMDEWGQAGYPGMLTLEMRVCHSSGRYIWFKDRMVRLS